MSYKGYKWHGFGGGPSPAYAAWLQQNTAQGEVLKMLSPEEALSRIVVLERMANDWLRRIFWLLVWTLLVIPIIAGIVLWAVLSSTTNGY